MYKEISNVKMCDGICIEFDKLLYQIDNTGELELIDKIILRECMKVIFSNSLNKHNIIFSLDALMELFNSDDDMTVLEEKINRFSLDKLRIKLEVLGSTSMRIFKLINDITFDESSLSIKISKSIYRCFKSNIEQLKVLKCK